MKPNLETIKQQADSVRLSSTERLDMLQSLRTYADAHPVRATSKAFWYRQVFAYASVLALVVGTGATSFAAEKSLPGDALYAVKTNVNEAVVRTLPLPASTKAKVEISMIDRRMGELEKMIATDVDTPEKVNLVMVKIDEHKEEFDEHLVAFAGEEEEESEVIHAELETVVDTHIVVLEELTSEDEPENVEDAPVELASAPADEPVEDPNAKVAITMSFRVAAPENADVTLSMKAAPAPVDPVVQELNQFAETEVRPFDQDPDGLSASSTKMIEENKVELRQRILRKAQKELNLDLDAHLDMGREGEDGDN